MTAANRRHLTLAEFCDEFVISRSTFYDWRAKGRAPKCFKLPNGELRIRRAEVDRWTANLEGGDL
jgi:predicted DNA-binding transcriptional regulator AlpA